MSQGTYRAVSFKSTYGFPKQCPDFNPNNSMNQTQVQLQTDYSSCLNENAQKFKMDLDAYLDSAQRFCCFVQEALKCETETLAKCDKNFAALNTVKTENLLNYSCPGMWPADCSELDSSSNLGMYLGIGIGSVLTFIFFGLIACYYKKWLCFGETIVDKLEIDSPISGSKAAIPFGRKGSLPGLKEEIQMKLDKVSELSNTRDALREHIKHLETKRMALDNDPDAAMAEMKSDNATEVDNPNWFKNEISRQINDAKKREQSMTEQMEKIQEELSRSPSIVPESTSQDLKSYPDEVLQEDRTIESSPIVSRFQVPSLKELASQVIKDNKMIEKGLAALRSKRLKLEKDLEDMEKMIEEFHFEKETIDILNKKPYFQEEKLEISRQIGLLKKQEKELKQLDSQKSVIPESVDYNGESSPYSDDINLD